MSDKLDIEAIGARVRDAERSLDDQKSDWCRSDLARRLVADIAALLAEVERLQRERSEWCDQADRRLTDYMTQQRDLLAENAALRERLTLTPEKVEAAAEKLNKLGGNLSFDDGAHPYFIFWESLAEAALLAAGMEEEALQ